MFENIVRETEMERIVRERTPDFFCGTNYYIGKFHSAKWQGVVHFKNGKKVIKTATVNNEIVRKEYDVAMPDFVLMNKNQMEHLRNSYEKAERGLNYSNPFSRKTGWYCEVFGDYWHSEEITTVPKEEHERQVIEAYESGGNHVLILWEKDILYHWKEYCEPKIKAYINDFLKENEVEENVEFYQGKCLSDLSLKCLNDVNIYRFLTQEEKETVLDNMVDVYKDVDLSCDKFEAKMDLMDYNKRIQNGFKVGLRGVINYDGNDLLNAFIKTRFDARAKNRRSLNELVKDEKLMRKCIDYQLSNETGTHHFKRFLSAMIFADGQRFVTNLNQSLIYNRLVEYSKEDGIFYDPCAGWGGRLLAAYAMKMKYIAIDANKKLVEELKQLAEFMNYKDCEIYYGDSSDCKFVEKIMNGRKIDLAFTCPPYFDEEIYSDDEFQSIKMYPNKEDWYKYFLDYMKKGVFEHLKEEGVFVLCIDEKLDLKNLTNVCINEFNATKSSDKEDKFYFVKNATETFVENVDFVRCELCGKGFQRLGSHLLKFHNMEIEDYFNQFPDAEIVCEKESQSVAERNRNKFDQPVKYKKRFVYLLPDGTYASKSDVYKREWNTQEVKDAHIIDASTIDYVPRYAEGIVNGEEGKDYVVCEICGYKAKSLTQHIRK